LKVRVFPLESSQSDCEWVGVGYEAYKPKNADILEKVV
jgi:hypothetical protein